MGTGAAEALKKMQKWEVPLSEGPPLQYRLSETPSTWISPLPLSVLYENELRYFRHVPRYHCASYEAEAR